MLLMHRRIGGDGSLGSWPRPPKSRVRVNQRDFHCHVSALFDVISCRALWLTDAASLSFTKSPLMPSPPPLRKLTPFPGLTSLPPRAHPSENGGVPGLVKPGKEIEIYPALVPMVGPSGSWQALGKRLPRADGRGLAFIPRGTWCRAGFSQVTEAGSAGPGARRALARPRVAADRSAASAAGFEGGGGPTGKGRRSRGRVLGPARREPWTWAARFITSTVTAKQGGLALRGTVACRLWPGISWGGRVRPRSAEHHSGPAGPGLQAAPRGFLEEQATRQMQHDGGTCAQVGPAGWRRVVKPFTRRDGWSFEEPGALPRAH
uniref:uncharacterized protein LOC103793414 n=1 Tax=Callithrix jacchus TaxID=9483 RepID=UPI0023DD5AC7|nr:uncharacterized protein LOC103793414 [Callithrix jacchus]XP_035157857.2 uncharacterized protein LOC103793414 [Callithrix jacchus]XP_035157858.2 uncharacterized protein LOC103793414 [Callithrix jacchus]